MPDKNDTQMPDNGQEEDAVQETPLPDTVEDIQAVEDDDELPPYQPKLTEQQQKLWQTVLGFVCGFAVWVSLWFSSEDQENGLLQWLFLLVFVAIMVIKNQVEKRTGVLLQTFMKFFLISLIIFLGVFVLVGVVTGRFASPA